MGDWSGDGDGGGMTLDQELAKGSPYFRSPPRKAVYVLGFPSCPRPEMSELAARVMRNKAERENAEFAKGIAMRRRKEIGQ